MKSGKITFILMMMAMLSGCVEDYQLPDSIASSYSEELYIEGRILSGDMSVFQISRTVPLSGFIPNTPITGAKITIVGENGYTSRLAADLKDGQYVLNTEALDTSVRYKVQILVLGEVYESSFQYLQDTPQIDEVTVREEPEQAAFLVSTHGAGSQQPYYQWMFEEDWEFHAPMDLTVTNGNGGFMFSTDVYKIKDGKNPYYYCWGHAESTDLYLYSAESLTDNRVVDYELQRIPYSDQRISSLYALTLKQCSLSREAYDYYRTLASYTQESAGLFTPMPSELHGNVRCVSSPKRSARGFIQASTVSVLRKFFDLSIHSSYMNCTPTETDPSSPQDWRAEWRDLSGAGFAAWVKELGVLDDGALLYHAECVDCRQSAGTKNKPSWWPNDHE